MSTCGDCSYFTSCFNSNERPNNEDHEICSCYLRYENESSRSDLQKAEVYARRLNEFCARIGLSGDVPQDVSIGCARDTD